MDIILCVFSWQDDMWKTSKRTPIKQSKHFWIFLLFCFFPLQSSMLACEEPSPRRRYRFSCLLHMWGTDHLTASFVDVTWSCTCISAKKIQPFKSLYRQLRHYYFGGRFPGDPFYFGVNVYTKLMYCYSVLAPVEVICQSCTLSYLRPSLPLRAVRQSDGHPHLHAGRHEPPLCRLRRL